MKCTNCRKNMEWDNIRYLFMCNCYKRKKESLINRFRRHLNIVLYGREVNCIIPKSTHFSHFGKGVTIGNKVILGENCYIYPHVTLGYKSGYPTIGNSVCIYANATIIGPITIGDNTVIGPGTFINKDLPPNSVVYRKQELIIKKKKIHIPHDS